MLFNQLHTTKNSKRNPINRKPIAISLQENDFLQ